MFCILADSMYDRKSYTTLNPPHLHKYIVSRIFLISTFSSPALKAQLSFSDHLLSGHHLFFCLSICLSVCIPIYIFNFFVRNFSVNLFKLGTKLPNKKNISLFKMLKNYYYLFSKKKLYEKQIHE